MTVNPVNWARDARQYISEVQAEYRKITWPSQKEAVAGTVGVVVIIAIVTLVLGTADFVLSRVFQLVLQ